MKTIIYLYRYYYSLAPKKFFVLLSVILLAVFLEGFGVSFALPMLQGLEDENKFNNFLKYLFSLMNVDYKLSNFLVFLVFVIALRSFFLFLQKFIASRIVVDLQIRMREKFSKKLFELDFLVYTKSTSGYLSNTLTRELEKVVACFANLAEVTVQSLFVLLYIFIPLCIKPSVVLSLLLLFLPLIFGVKMIMSKTKKISSDISQSNSDLQQVILQSLNNFKYLKSTNSSNSVLGHLFKVNKAVGEKRLSQTVLGAFSQHAFEPFVIIALCSVIYYSVEIKGERLIEQFFVLFMLMKAMNNLISLQNSVRKLVGSWGSVEATNKLEVILDEGKEKTRSNENTKFIFKNEMLIEDLSFSYGDKSLDVLKEINLSVPCNSTVAFVGESGSGKSSLVNLMIGLLSPSKGNIYYDGQSINEIDKNSLRSNIGYITQENVVFHDTIFNNITLWDFEEESKERALKRVEEACRKAHVDDFINSLPNKYNSVLGEGGVNISGGQRQRIAIARELYKKSKLLVFDEATSALDTPTEREIQKNIDELKGEKTIILVAHRLSTVKNADIIFVLKDGQIVEQGSYESLYELQGEFRKMVNLQS